MSATRLTGAAGAITALGLLTLAFVGNWEGLRLVAYKDVIGVWTGCYGETKGIKSGMKFTQEQCDVMFIDGLARHEAGMRRCLRWPDAIPDKTYVAFLSFTYNVGVGAFCRSGLARKANAGDLVGACNELPKWNKAGSKVLKGLVARRAKEKRLCLDGLEGST